MKSMTFRNALTSAALAASLFASGMASAAETIVPPAPAPVLPACRHWDKIVFKITDAYLAEQFKLIPNDPYDIKVLDNPRQVADLKRKVLSFLNGSRRTYDLSDRAKVEIISVAYALDCSLAGMLTPRPPIELPK